MVKLSTSGCWTEYTWLTADQVYKLYIPYSRKLSWIGEKYDFRRESFCRLLVFAVPKDGTPPNFVETTFANSHKTTKVFSLESFGYTVHVFPSPSSSLFPFLTRLTCACARRSPCPPLYVFWFNQNSTSTYSPHDSHMTFTRGTLHLHDIHITFTWQSHDIHTTVTWYSHESHMITIQPHSPGFVTCSI